MNRSAIMIKQASKYLFKSFIVDFEQVFTFSVLLWYIAFALSL